MGAAPYGEYFLAQRNAPRGRGHLQHRDIVHARWHDGGSGRRGGGGDSDSEIRARAEIAEVAVEFSLRKGAGAAGQPGSEVAIRPQASHALTALPRER